MRRISSRFSAAIGFGSKVDFDAVSITGITEVRAADIAQASQLGFVIRLIGVADSESGAGGTRLLQRVRPCLVPKHHPLAHVTGPTNAVVAEGNFSGRLLFQGAGAGDGPTASAVVADVIDIARGDATPPFSLPVDQLVSMEAADPGHRVGRDYIRFTVADRPGVLAEITAATRDADVSIESLIQQTRSPDGGEVLVAMVTHEGEERCVTKALELLDWLAQPDRRASGSSHPAGLAATSSSEAKSGASGRPSSSLRVWRSGSETTGVAVTWPAGPIRARPGRRPNPEVLRGGPRHR